MLRNVSQDENQDIKLQFALSQDHIDKMMDILKSDSTGELQVEILGIMLPNNDFVVLPNNDFVLNGNLKKSKELK